MIELYEAAPATAWAQLQTPRTLQDKAVLLTFAWDADEKLQTSDGYTATSLISVANKTAIHPVTVDDVHASVRRLVQAGLLTAAGPNPTAPYWWRIPEEAFG